VIFTLIGITLSGIACGALLRGRKLRGLQRITTVMIWVLLFLLGVEVGGDNHIIESLHTLGLESVVICLCSTLGSVVAAWLLWRRL
jgi:uncharacterized membrane protein YbjE (DUF340 family)